MKILYLGQLAQGQTCRMRMEELEKLGNEVIGLDSKEEWDSCSWLSKHIQKRLAFGPAIKRLNSKVMHLAEEHRPDMLWADKQEYLNPRTLEALRQRKIRTVHFTPDPYFTLKWKRTRIMDRCMPLWDYVVTSKRYEVADYERVSRRVLYMPLGFSEHMHRPSFSSDPELRSHFASDVAFLGGWEPRREELLAAVASTGCDLKIWGYSWDHLIDGRWSIRRACRLSRNAGIESFRIARNESIAKALKGTEIYGEEYAWALSGAKIGLGFLRKVCPDQHTTRTFEIPACRSMMLADRTDEHKEFFVEGKEAEFFSSKQELVEKTQYYLKNDRAREEIAERGYLRCLNSGYSYRHRMSQTLAEIS